MRRGARAPGLVVAALMLGWVIPALAPALVPALAPAHASAGVGATSVADGRLLLADSSGSLTRRVVGVLVSHTGVAPGEPEPGDSAWSGWRRFWVGLGLVLLVSGAVYGARKRQR